MDAGQLEPPERCGLGCKQREHLSGLHDQDHSRRAITRSLPAALGVKLNAYLLDGLTEFWRAYRHYAGIYHFVYLTNCDPQGYTCNNFKDLRTLQLHPEFKDYVSQAFAPLGVYINFWHPQLIPGPHAFPVMLINDLNKPLGGNLALVLENEAGRELARNNIPFSVAALGQTSLLTDFNVPEGQGRCTLKAIAQPNDAQYTQPTVSRRWGKVIKSQLDR